MSLTPLSTTSAASLTATSGAQQSRPPRYVQTAAKALGMDPSDVMSALRSGKSLADLAKQQGVSTDTLTTALKADAPANAQGAPDIDARLQKLVSQQGLGVHHGHHGHGAPSSASPATGALTGTLTADQQSTLSTCPGCSAPTPPRCSPSCSRGRAWPPCSTTRASAPTPWRRPCRRACSSTRRADLRFLADLSSAQRTDQCELSALAGPQAGPVAVRTASVEA